MAGAGACFVPSSFATIEATRLATTTISGSSASGAIVSYEWVEP